MQFVLDSEFADGVCFPWSPCAPPSRGGNGIVDMLWGGSSLALGVAELIHCRGVRQCCVGVPRSGGRPVPPGCSGSFVRAFTRAGCSLCLLDSQLYLNVLEIHCQSAELQINSSLLRCVGRNHPGLFSTLRVLSLQQHRPKESDEAHMGEGRGLWFPGKVLHSAVAAKGLVKPTGDHLACSMCLTLSFPSSG